VNDPPTALPFKINANEDTTVSIDVSTYVDDIEDGNKLTLDATSVNGTIHNIEGTVFQYTPKLNYNGNDVITYTVSDTQGITASAQIDVVVANVNDHPISKDFIIEIDEDTSTLIDVSQYVSDVEDGIYLKLTASAEKGYVTNIHGTTFLYSPTDNYNGIDTIIYTVTDSVGVSSSSSIEVTIHSVNDPPVATDFNVNTYEDTSVQIDVVPYVTDIDNSSDFTLHAVAQNGIISEIIGGVMKYTPSLYYNGVDHITYTVTDTGSSTATADITVTIIEVNSVPIAEAFSIEINEDNAVMISVSDYISDVEDKTELTLSVTSTNGTISELTGRTFKYTPKPNFNGLDVLSYTVVDKNGASAYSTISVTVFAINDLPISSNFDIQLVEDSFIDIDLSNYITDVDDYELLILTASAGNGNISNISGLRLRYTSNLNYNGTDTIHYTVTDSDGGQSSSYISIKIASINDIPTAKPFIVETTSTDSISIDISSNINDVEDGDNLSVYASALTGIIRDMSGTRFTYIPSINYKDIDTITYKVVDNEGAESSSIIKVIMGSINNTPIARDFSIESVEDTSKKISVKEHISDVEDGTNLLLVVRALNGNISNIIGTEFHYIPHLNYTGVDTIIYSVTDSNGSSTSAAIIVNIQAINDLPIADDIIITMTEDTTIVINVSDHVSDVEDNNDLKITSANANFGRIHNLIGMKMTYTPDKDFYGVDYISYNVIDPNGGETTGNIKVNVTGTNDKLIVSDFIIHTTQETATTINVDSHIVNVDNDTMDITYTALRGKIFSPNGTTFVYLPDLFFSGTDTITYIVTDNEQEEYKGEITVNVSSVLPVAKPFNVGTTEDVSININVLSHIERVDPSDTDILLEVISQYGVTQNITNLSFSYTPNTNFNGVDNLTYKLTIGDVIIQSYIVLSVFSVNDAPVATDFTVHTDEDTPIIIDVEQFISDVDDNLFTLTVSSNHGETTIPIGTEFIYTPVSNFYGTDVISYTIADSHNVYDSAKITVFVGSVNDAPICSAFTVETVVDMSINIDVAPYIKDVDSTEFSVTAVSQKGVVHMLSGTVIKYTPILGYMGVDTIIYTTSDNMGGITDAQITVVVNVNNIPQIADLVVSMKFNTIAVFDILSFATDLDINDILTVTNIRSNNGVSTVLSNGQLQYKPDIDYVGIDKIYYDITDNKGGIISASLLVTIGDDTLPIVPTCFPENTPVNTDQGIIPICKIDVDKHTINRCNIVAVTQIISKDMDITSVKRGAFGKNRPTQDTIISNNHQVLYNNCMVRVGELVDIVDGVNKIPYDKNILYNILLEHHSQMIVNGLTVETMHPDNIVAKLITADISPEDKTQTIKDVNDFLTNRKFTKYYQIRDSL
jgi:hypothetical protein